MKRKLNLTKKEILPWIEALIDYMEDLETIEIEKNYDRFVLTVPEEIINSYEDETA